MPTVMSLLLLALMLLGLHSNQTIRAHQSVKWSSPGLVDTQLSLSKMGGGVFSAKIETKSWQATGVHA